MESLGLENDPCMIRMVKDLFPRVTGPRPRGERQGRGLHEVGSICNRKLIKRASTFALSAGLGLLCSGSPLSSETITIDPTRGDERQI